jgi:uncharacterized protein
MTQSIAQRLDALYERVPADAAPCMDGCRACCGPIPLTKTEWARIKKAHPHDFEARQMPDKTLIAIRDVKLPNGRVVEVCPFAQDGPLGCAVYEERPMMCRLFGTTFKMHCRYGYKSAPQLSRAEFEEIMQEYYAIQRADR